MAIDFTPTMKGYTGQGAFRFWCQTVLPLVYDDSLSYYELLNKVVHYLNNTIADVANVEENVDGLLNAYNQLQQYVNDYFDNLDVQNEIDEKLDEMAASGRLNELIDPIIPSIVGQWLHDNITPTTPAIDRTLTVDNAAANAKTVGDKAVLTGGIYTSWDKFLADFGGDYNNLPVNRLVCIGSTFHDALNAPLDAFIGTVNTVAFSQRLQPGDYQLAVSVGGNIFERSYRISGGVEGWSNWERVAYRSWTDNEIESKTITHYSTMINSLEQLSEITGGTNDANDFPANKIITIGANSVADALVNGAVVGTLKTGTYICYNYGNHSGAGYVQLFVCSGGMASRWKIASGWQPWRVFRDVDTTLAVEGKPADAEAVGKRAVLTGGIYTSWDKFLADFGGDYNNFPVNRLVCVGSNTFTDALNAPFVGFVGIVNTVAYNNNLMPGSYQLAVSVGGSIYERGYRISSGAASWGEWERVAYRSWVDDEIDAKGITHYGTMITSAERLNTLTGGTMSANDFPANKIITVGTSASKIGLLNGATVRGATTGTYVTYNFNDGSSDGCVQFFVSTYGSATRWKVSGNWQSWCVNGYDEDVYYVGASRDDTSITALFQRLANNNRRKIIYIDPGVYDIFKEYRDAGIPTPPDDVTSGDYIDRVVAVPNHTKLIGLGNVTLKWNPDETVTEHPEIAPITYGEARTWSPLNVFRECEVENITITCYKGRYCIHDDSHNNTSDQGVRHTYKNVRCYYTDSPDGYGFNNVIGFGFSSRNKYLFENCVFEMIGKDHHAFYGHGASGSTLYENYSPNIVVNNCIVIGGPNGTGTAIRLQNLATSQLNIKTSFNGCYIKGRVVLTNYSAEAKQGFDLTLLKSGEHTVEYNGETANPYTAKIYA